MRIRLVVLALFGIVLVLAGSMVWRSRFAYYPEQTLQTTLGSRLLEVPLKTTVDLSDACRVATEEEGWILFVLNSSLANDSQIRTFFETAEEPLGLYVEYEPGLFRLGLGMGPGNVNEAGETISNIELPIRRVHQKEENQVFIGVTKEETRIVTNTRDARVAWPGYLADEWKCNAVQIADDERPSTHGYTCMGCDARLRYATGKNLRELEGVLSTVSNVSEFNIRRWAGTVLTLCGLVIAARAFKSMRGHQGNRFPISL